MQDKNLHNRQFALYEYLKTKGDEWTTQAQISRDLPEFYPCGDFSDYHNSNARLKITADIRTLNESGLIQKIILSGAKGVKIATEEEFDHYIGKQINAAVRRLNRFKNLAAKGNRDGQTRIVFNSERDTIKAFLDSDRAFGERLKLARLRANLSQAQTVAAMHEYDNTFDAPMLSRIEKGHCLPNRSTLARLAVIYGVSREYLLMGNLSDETETGQIDGLQAVKYGVK